MKRSNKIVKNAIKNNLYNGYDIGEVEDFCILNNGVKYYISPQYTRLIDQYDPVTGNVEQSHKEYDGYSLITGYESDDSSITGLDFTFASNDDIIDTDIDDSIKEVKLNSSNLKSTNLKTNNQLDLDIVVKENIIESFIELKRFIENNRDIIASINIEGISENKIYQKIFGKICGDYEIYILTFIDKPTKNNIVKLKK